MRICVFCGSAADVDPRFLVAARVVGQEAARRGHGIVYGGSSSGLMGQVADGCLSGGGQVIGVIPQSLVDREIAHRGLTRLEVVQTLHQRKARMMELSDAVAVLPGGFGTLDEAFELMTWRMLNLHQKPVAFLNALDFWKPLAALTEHLHAQRFVKAPHHLMVQLCPTPETLLDALDPHLSASRRHTLPAFGPKE